MSKLLQHLREFIDSPRGKRLVGDGRRQLTDPANRQKAKKLLDKVRGGRTRGR